MQPDLTSIVNVLERLIQQQEKGWLEYANITVLFFTLVALAIYTYETIKLRRAAQEQIKLLYSQTTFSARQLAESIRQTEHSNRPILIVQFEKVIEINRQPIRLVYRNIGTAPAFDVSCQPSASGAGTLKLRSVMVVPQGDITQTTLVYLDSSGNVTGGGDHYDDVIKLFHDKNIESPNVFVLTYKNADGILYSSGCIMRKPTDQYCFGFDWFERSLPLPSVPLPSQRD